MDNLTPLIILLATLPAVLVSVVAALNARKTNARWRERRAQARADGK